MRIEEDKIQHFVACATIACVASFVMAVLGVTYLPCVVASFMVAMSCAVGKEFGDMRAVGNRWDWRDIIADLMGAILGALAFGMFTFT